MPPSVTENPFSELYLSEAIEDPILYSRWFSPAILTGQTEGLFRKENTVLRGSNGTGKTMLLRLLSSSVREAYLNNPGDFRLPDALRSSIGLSVNFLHAGFGSLGRRRLRKDQEANEEQWTFLFADLLNYYVVASLLETLAFLKKDGRGVADEIAARLECVRLDAFACCLASHPCWFGALQDVKDFGALRERVRRRIESYGSFVNWNTNALAPGIRSTKSSIGQPILAARDALRRTEVLDERVALIVTLDQYESLYHVDYGSATPEAPRMGSAFCRVVNSLLALRAPAVFCKIGVRHYAWGRELRGLNTDQSLERKRDYELIDLDEVLRRQENTKSWIFPRFAADVAARRIAASKGGSSGDYVSWFEKKLERLQPDEEIQKYDRGGKEGLVPYSRDAVAEGWREALGRMYGSSKYRAKLAEAWTRQRLGRGGELGDAPRESDMDMPWDREWWQKERREALLTQVASECQQRKLYAGWETLLTLSGANVLIFINLCREIWDHWQRAQSKAREPIEVISADVQSQAVRIVAAGWLEKQEEFPNGGTRRRFVERLGIAIRKEIIADRALSYPGHNGFSVVDEDWKKDDAVRRFLEGAEDYGALVGFPHTTKERDRRRRRKWYLTPILCPNFEIPAIRTKEPYYAGVQEVRMWVLAEAQEIRFLRGSRGGTARPSGPSLFR